MFKLQKKSYIGFLLICAIATILLPVNSAFASYTGCEAPDRCYDFKYSGNGTSTVSGGSLYFDGNNDQISWYQTCDFVRATFYDNNGWFVVSHSHDKSSSGTGYATWNLGDDLVAGWYYTVKIERSGCPSGGYVDGKLNY